MTKKWDEIGPQCEKCKGNARKVFICDECEFPEEDCICEVVKDNDEMGSV